MVGQYVPKDFLSLLEGGGELIFQNLFIFQTIGFFWGAIY